MKKKTLKTQTLASKRDQDNPTHTICKGHVTTTIFNKAWKAEGWSGDWISKLDLMHMWSYKTPSGGYMFSVKKTEKHTKPVTVMHW